MADFQESGTINLASWTTTAYVPAFRIKPGANKFKEGGKILLQLGSANLSGAVTCTFQISVDGNYWEAAEVDGTDITFSLDTTTPIVRVITGVEGLWWRVAVTINSKTGVISYIAKDVK